MGKKTRTVSNKAGKLMKCDGKLLKKVVEAKGYKLHELSKMLRYCSDYLTTCCRTNQISDVAAKYLMDYKIFPKMYDLEGEIKIDESNEDKTTTSGEHVRGKIDKDDRDEAARDRLKKRMDMINANSTYGIPKSEAKENLYMLSLGLKYFFKGMLREAKNDPEIKAMIKQAVKEAYEEL